jgi:signal transduction histidine kinase
MARRADFDPVTPRPSTCDHSAVDDPASIRAAERLRITDQLHDTACQLLALLQLNLGMIRRLDGQEREALIVECEGLVANIGRQLREVGEDCS